MKQESKSRFPLILLASVAIHLGVLAMLYGAWVYQAALQFGSFTFGDDGEAKYKVSDIDRTKPLFLPNGFYAVERPPDVVKKHDDRPKTDDKKKAAKKSEDVAKKDDEDQTKKTDDAKPVAESPNPQFGHISGNAIKPHLVNIYHAYEEGRITTNTFTVTVACKALPDGSLTNIELAKSSGDDLIDETAVTIVKELGAMKALAPLASLSSLSITLQKTPTSATLTAVGFANDPDVTANFANQLSALKMLSRFKLANDDQRRLLEGVQISGSGNRISVSLGLPSSVASDLMRRSFSSKDTAKTGA